MTLAGVKPGDVVRVAGAHGFVIEKARGKLQLQWIGSHARTWVKAGEVEAHWSRRKR